MREQRWEQGWIKRQETIFYTPIYNLTYSSSTFTTNNYDSTTYYINTTSNNTTSGTL